MTNLWIKEMRINSTENYRFGDSEWYETGFNDRGKLFRSLQREYGRCISKLYYDDKDGNAVDSGYVFLKKSEYEDTREPFLLETWIEIKEVAEGHKMVEVREWREVAA
jgi:hypothetical protein